MVTISTVGRCTDLLITQKALLAIALVITQKALLAIVQVR